VDWAENDLEQCVQASRLLGADPTLVLHGGGNSSVKTGEVIFVKGTGRDLATIDASGFAPLRLDRLRELLELDELSDGDMVRELAAARLDPAAPQPSVEALLHAFIPHAAVLHSHADAIVALTNRRKPVAFADDVLVVPYVRPGFELARAVKEAWRDAAALVLDHHGLFTWGADAREAYERHLALVEWARAQLPEPEGDAPELPEVPVAELADLRLELSRAAGRALVTRRVPDARAARLSAFATRGPLTPDHVIRTKRVPLVGRDVDSYVRDYEAYFAEHAREGLTMLDPAPRIVLDPRLGLVAAGESARAAQIAADIYEHTLDVLERVGDEYEALSPRELFDVEYWELEQAKLGRTHPPFAGAVALVTGAASGIGLACAEALREAGAEVAGVDVQEGGFVADVTDAGAMRRVLRSVVESFGGLDIVVVCAGIFRSAPIAELGDDDWRETFAVNVDSVARLFRDVHPLLARSPIGGRVAVVASKNVAAPGRGAAAYSASKAALTQLARVAALEWARDGIRVNVVHPDAVFDTGLWTDELLAERAAQAGLDVDAYKRRNLLGIEVTSADVAQVVLAVCSDAFRATTGAQIPVDGGNERVI
jgi:rhamnose utilization protein RhaD (predicted bifunctional aldolase and dehydrogenase)/NAD(P)-dependent dehydrogenase (short-subunit alcohol dehydrogenase family)